MGMGPASGGAGAASAGRSGGAAAAAQAAPQQHRQQRETSALGRISRQGPPNQGLRPAAAWSGLGTMASARGAAVGAGGQRPVLAWAGVSPTPPNQSRPQQVGLGTTSAEATATAVAAAADGTSQGGAGPPRGNDGDGFTVVGSRGRARGGPPPAQQQPAAAATSSTSQAGAAASADDGDGVASGRAADGEPAAGERTGPTDAQAEEASTPTADELKSQWLEAQRLLEVLEGQGLPAGHPVREAARQQAEAAKLAWEESRPGVGVSKRLVYAEQALARARKSQARCEQSIADLDDEYEAERERRMQTLHDLRARTRAREEFLAQLSRQAAQEFQGGAADIAGGQAELAVATMEGPIRDAIQEALDTAPVGSELRTRLSGALGALSEVASAITRPRPRWADHEPRYGDADEERWEEAWWGNGDGGTWYADAWDDRHASAGCGSAHADEEVFMDTAEVAAPAWIHGAASGGHGGEAMSRAPKRWRREADDDGGVQGRQANSWEVPQDHEQAARLQAAVNEAERASAAAPAPPTPNMAELALERKRQEVWDLAQDQGAEISSETIANMSMAELEEWQAATLL